MPRKTSTSAVNPQSTWKSGFCEFCFCCSNPILVCQSWFCPSLIQADIAEKSECSSNNRYLVAKIAIIFLNLLSLFTIILLHVSINSGTDSLDHHSRNSIMLLLYMLQTALVLIYFNLVKNLRYFIRKKCNLKGSQFQDCFVSIVCQPCVTIQMAHEYEIFEKRFDYDSMEATRFRKLVSYLERKRIKGTILYV